MNYTVKMSEEAENNLKAVIEYISIEKFDNAIEDEDLDEKLKKYADEFAPYILYPQHYKF